MKYLILLLIVVGCADLRTYEEGTCGNNVVEAPREDCDVVVDSTLGERLRCGAPDTPNECRYLCSGGSSCPDGWACFSDDVCRPASGRFEVDDEPVLLFRADQIELQNFVGDGAAELAVRLDSDLTLYSLEEDAERAALYQGNIRTVRGAMTSAVTEEDDVGEVGRSIMFIPGALQFADSSDEPFILALEASGDRLVSAAAPRLPIELPLGAELEIVAAARLDDESGVDDALYAGRLPVGAGFAFLTPGCTDMREIAAVIPPAVAGAALLPPKFFRLADGRRRVALGFDGGSTITLGTTALTNGCVTLEDISTLVLPGPLNQAGFDFRRVADGDFFVDLVAYLDNEQVAVASGDGASFGAAGLSEPHAVLDELPDTLNRECDGEKLVLASGQLQEGNGVQPDDFVTENAIFFSTPSGYERVFTRTRGDAWGEAVIGDFDRDGHQDVVVSTRSRSADCGSVDLRFIRQGRNGSFTSTPILNISRARNLQRGDFDGDGIDDVVFIQSAPDSGDAVSVLYGDTKEALEDQSTVSGFERIRAIESVVTREGPELNLDQVSDVIILPEGEENTITVMLGTPRRSLVAPIALDGLSRQGRGAAPFAAVAGRFSEASADEPDLVAIGEDAAWMIAGEDLEWGGPISKGALDVAPFRPKCALLAASSEHTSAPIIGVDGYFLQNPGLLTHPTPDGECLFLEQDSTLLWLEPDTSSGTLDFEIAMAPAPAGARVPTQMVLADLDRSGTEDLIVHFAFSEDVLHGQAFVFWNPRRVGRVIELNPVEPELILPGQIVHSVAAINLDEGDDLELAVYGEAGLATFKYDEDTGRLEATDGPVIEPPDFSPEDGAIMLRAGEVNGDGLEDLVLLYGEGLFVYQAQPRN